MISNRKMTTLLLVMVLLAAALFPAGAYAATGDVYALDFDSSAKVELTVGQTPKQLKVLASVEGSTSKKDVTAGAVWTSSDTGVATVSSGLVTPKNSGTAMITATYNNTVATIEVSVTYAYKNLTITAPSSGVFKLGDSDDDLLVKATAVGGDAADTVNDVTQDAEWSSSNSQVLTVTKGQLTLVGEGSATVTAKYKGLTATFKATVLLPYSALELKDGSGTAVEELEMLVGDSPVAIQAFTKGTEAEDVKNVTDSAEWTSSSPTTATVEKGKITPVGTGKTVITVKYLGVTQTVDVYVRAPYEALLLTPTGDQSLFIGESLGVKAEVRDAINSTLNISNTAVWTSGNKLAATVTTGDTQAAIAAKSAGSAVIKAEYKGVSRELKLTVYPTLSDLSTDSSEVTLYTGETASLPKVNGTKLDGTKLEIGSELEWTSANEDTAMIKDGKIVAGKAGTVVLTGKIKANDAVTSASAIRTKSVSVTVTVKEKVLVLLGPEDKLGAVTGEETQLPTITAVMESGEERDVTSEIEWTVSGTSAVIKQGTSGKILKGLTKGSVTLKGTYSNKTISIPVVVEQKIIKIDVDPATLEMNIKGSKSIKATGYTSAGKTVNLSSTMNWVSSNPTAATVKGTTVKALAEGTTTLTGSYQGIAVSVKISVVPKLTKLTVSEKSLKLAPGGSKSVAVTAEYDTGKTAVVTGAVVWTSSKPSVVSISQNGTITALAKGTASVKGKFGTKTITVSVTVK